MRTCFCVSQFIDNNCLDRKEVYYENVEKYFGYCVFGYCGFW